MADTKNWGAVRFVLKTKNWVMDNWVDHSGQVRDTWGWIRDGASLLSPSRFPWGKRKGWANPAKMPGTFEGAMYRSGCPEGRMRRTHAMLACSALISLTGALTFTGLAVLWLFEARAGACMSALGAAAVTGAVFATHSFRSWQLRRRDFNLGLSDFANAPYSWVPPIAYADESGDQA